MAKKKGHFGEGDDLSKLHKLYRKPDKTEGGACLTGHQGSHSGFNGKSTCNYRYQAVEQARSHSKIKAYLHSYNKFTTSILIARKQEEIKTSVYRTKSGGLSPGHYVTHLPLPNPGDWDVGGPNRNIVRKTIKGSKVTIKRGLNFSQDTWPYWNNAHHLIPKGTLKSEIVNEGSPVSDMIQFCLLSAQYNINHKINMLFMPQDKEVGKILHMPRHIQLREDDADARVALSCTNHPIYNQMTVTMEGGLEKIILKFRKTALKATKGKCVKKDAKMDKKALENLSEKLLKMILVSRGGESLDSIAHSINPN